MNIYTFHYQTDILSYHYVHFLLHGEQVNSSSSPVDSHYSHVGQVPEYMGVENGKILLKY